MLNIQLLDLVVIFYGACKCHGIVRTLHPESRRFAYEGLYLALPITHKLVIPNSVIIQIFKIKIWIGIEKQWDLATKDWMFIVLRYYVSWVYTKASENSATYKSLETDYDPDFNST